jgi:hypothetical protein
VTRIYIWNGGQSRPRSATGTNQMETFDRFRDPGRLGLHMHTSLCALGHSILLMKLLENGSASCYAERLLRRLCKVENEDENCGRRQAREIISLLTGGMFRVKDVEKPPRS